MKKIIATIILMIVSIFNNVYGETAYYTTENTYASSYYTQAVKMKEIIIAKDVNAFKMMMDNGSIIQLRSGLKVFVTDTSYDKSISKCRVEGTLTEFWTMALMLSKDPVVEE